MEDPFHFPFCFSYFLLFLNLEQNWNFMKKSFSLLFLFIYSFFIVISFFPSNSIIKMSHLFSNCLSFLVSQILCFSDDFSSYTSATVKEVAFPRRPFDDSVIWFLVSDLLGISDRPRMCPLRSLCHQRAFDSRINWYQLDQMWPH